MLDAQAVQKQVQEALVMELLRRDQLSEVQAATLLPMDRWELLDAMDRARVPTMRLSEQEQKCELGQEILRDRSV